MNEHVHEHTHSRMRHCCRTHIPLCVCSCESCSSNPHQTVCVCLPSGGSSSPACTHGAQARPQLQISTHPESSTLQQAPPSYRYFGTGSITIPCPRPASPYASIAHFLLPYAILVQDPGVFCHLPFIWCKNMRMTRGSVTMSLSKTTHAQGKSCFARAIISFTKSSVCLSAKLM